MIKSASLWKAVASFAPARQMGAVGSCITRPPSPKILRPRTEGAQYLMTSVALPILPVAVSGGLVCAHPVPRAANRTANNKKDFIRFFLRATLPFWESGGKRVRCEFDGIYFSWEN